MRIGLHIVTYFYNRFSKNIVSLKIYILWNNTTLRIKSSVCASHFAAAKELRSCVEAPHHGLCMQSHCQKCFRGREGSEKCFLPTTKSASRCFSGRVRGVITCSEKTAVFFTF